MSERRYVRRYPHQLVVMADDPMNDFVRRRAEDENKHIAEVLRELIDLGRQAVERPSTSRRRQSAGV